MSSSKPFFARQRYSSRPFWLTLGAVLLFCLLSIALDQRASYLSSGKHDDFLRGTRAHRGLGKRDEKCRLVHHAEDKCAFVKANCEDEEAGLLSYLQLYYCRLPQAQPFAFALIAFWLGLLFTTIGIAASDFFCVNLSTISSLLGLSESIAGVTFLAFGNGSPDVFSTFAAMRTQSGSLAIGELIGAASFITTVVAGSMALVRPFKVARKSFVRDLCFFIVAAAFSMGFLADGKLTMWECTTMICFYLVYVVTVVVWHWMIRRRIKRKYLEAVSRDHFLGAPSRTGTGESSELSEPEEENEEITLEQEDFGLLESAGRIGSFRQEDDDMEESREHLLAEINRNMRVSRPVPNKRTVTTNSIRPSLFGALEFRAVLSSLGKSRNQQGVPISHLRRHSYDPAVNAAGVRRQGSSASSVMEPPDPQSQSAVLFPTDASGTRKPLRDRAVSALDARSTTQNRLVTGPPLINLIDEQSAESDQDDAGSGRFVETPTQITTHMTSPDGRLAPPGTQTPTSSNELSVPGASSLAIPVFGRDVGSEAERQGSPEPPSPSLARQNSLGRSPNTAGSSPIMPFPAYHDDPNDENTPLMQSLRLPNPSLGFETAIQQQQQQSLTGRPIKWWPYSTLPSPSELISTLFPTLSMWKQKSHLQRIQGIIAAPSVFLLTITLPVVEVERRKDLEDPSDIDESTANFDGVRYHDDPSDPNAAPSGPEVRVQDEHEHASDTLRAPSTPSEPSTQHDYADHPVAIKGKGWDRWLLFTQTFTAPFFVVLIIWANMDDSKTRLDLVLWVSYALIGSLVVFAALILTTSEREPPKFRPLLCFVGFIVSVAWISTIAGEVVGVLKSFGVILGISDAILGLTIFAVGNSLGDLVADITVARLGFPVMALSACFGGPMLNILLGIGISGLYMTGKSARKHHRQDGHFDMSESFDIEVGSSLIISGIALLITLVGLLFAVACNKWVMDKRIGWGLVILWSVSTTLNVILEASGMGF